MEPRIRVRRPTGIQIGHSGNGFEWQQGVNNSCRLAPDVAVLDCIIDIRHDRDP